MSFVSSLILVGLIDGNDLRIAMRYDTSHIHIIGLGRFNNIISIYGVEVSIQYMFLKIVEYKIPHHKLMMYYLNIDKIYSMGRIYVLFNICAIYF
jgi:hypothetical protein